MRAFVFLLILANLMFLAWTQGYIGASSDPDALRVQQQLLADQVKVVARDEPPAETIKTEKAVKAVEKKVEEVCFLMSDLPIAEIVRLESVLAEKLNAFRAMRIVNAAAASYWVYISPLATRQEADKKATELKKLRVPEFFVVQDAGANYFAVSLGIFSSRQAANDRLEQLRTKGVKSARVGERDGKSAVASLEIYGPEAQSDKLRQAVAEALPERKLTVCNAPAPTAQ